MVKIYDIPFKDWFCHKIYSLIFLSQESRDPFGLKVINILIAQCGVFFTFLWKATADHGLH